MNTKKIMYWYCITLRVCAILFILFAVQQMLTHPADAGFLPVHQN